MDSKPSVPPSDSLLETEAASTSEKRSGLMKKKIIFVVVVLIFGIILAAIVIGVIFSKNDVEDRLPDQYTYSSAAVAADHQACSNIGRDILKKGGSAADAGIAAMFCVGLESCHNAGIGGGNFALFYNRTTASVISVNAREKAPLAANENMFVGTYNASSFGGLAVAVPGELKGYYELHQRAGRLPWRELILPSIEMARNGFSISGALAIAINKNEDTIKADKSLSEVLTDSNGNLLKENDILRLPKLAATLAIVAESGNPEPFYTGKLAAEIVEEVKSRGGIITTDDLARYTAEVHNSSLMVKLDDMTMYSQRPPASGAVASFILNILDGYDFSSVSVSNNLSGLTYHRIAEAFKFGFARRAELGDDDFENVDDVVNYMLSEDVARRIMMNISDTMTHDPDYYGGGKFGIKEDKGTTHVSVIDVDGNALALSSTINLYFGSKVRGNKTGIFYNNEMDDFSTPNTTNYFGVPASPSNFIKPEKRPMSSMVPIIIVNSNGDVRLVTGGAGGTTITTSTALVVMHSLWFKDNVKEALERKRIHHQLYPTNVVYEEGINDNILKGLTDRGHEILSRSSIAVEQLVTKEGNTVNAYSDPRKPGHGAAGY